MRNSGGPLDYAAIVDDSNWNGFFQRGNQQLIGLSNTAKREANALDQTFSRIGRAAASAFAFVGLAQLPADLVRVRGEFQQLETSFTAILRSKEKADALFGDIKQYALVNPSSVQESARAAKQLLAYGLSAEKIIPTLNQLGDLSAGVGTSLGDLAYLVGTTFTQGRVYVQDFNQFVGRGIPLGKALADTMGVAESEVRKLVEAGKVGFPEVEKAIASLTTKGGLFAGLSQEVNKSLIGLTSQFKDAWENMLNEIGKDSEGILGGAISGATDLVKSYREVAQILTVVAAGYGGYRAALLVSTVAQMASIPITKAQAIAQAEAANATGFLTLSQTRLAASTSLIARAQAAFNATAFANPYVLIGTALAALTTAYFVFRQEATKLKTAQELLAEKSQDTTTKFTQQQGEIKNLVSVIKDQNIADSQRLLAYNRLRDISPDIVKGLTFEQAKTADLTKSVNDYIVALRQRLRLEASQGALKEAYEQDAEAAKKLQEANEKLIEQAKKAKASEGSRTSGPESGAGIGASLVADKLRIEANLAAERRRQTLAVVKQVEEEGKRIYAGGSKEYLDAQIEAKKALLKTIADPKSANYKLAEDELKSLTEQREKLNAANDKGNKIQAKTIDQLGDEIKAKRDSLNTGMTPAQKKKVQKEIADLEKQKRDLEGKLSPAERRAANEADKAGMLGSSAYWSMVAQKASEIIEKTNNPAIRAAQQQIKDNALEQVEAIRRSVEAPLGTIPYYEALIAEANKALEKLPEGADPAKIATQRYIIEQAQAQADEIRKRNAVRTFEEELAEKQKQYELYNNWVRFVGQEAADQQFASLKKQGAGYVDYLKQQVVALDLKAGLGGGLSKEEAAQRAILGNKLTEATGGETPMQVFVRELEQAQREAGTLTQYIDVLQRKLDGLKSDPTDEGANKRTEIGQRLINAKNERTDNLQQFLQQVAGTQQRRLAIERQYADLRAQAETTYSNKTSKEYIEAIAAIEKARKEEIKAVNQELAEGSDEFKEFTKTITSEGRKGLKERLDQANKAYTFTWAKYGEDSEQFRKAVLEKRQAERDLANDRLQYYQEFAQFFGELGNMLSGLTGELGQVGKLLSGLSSGAGRLVNSFKPGLTGQEKLNMGLSAGLDLINIITSSSAQRQQAETDFIRNQIALQNQYNLALNEQIGLQASMDSNVFVKDKEKALRGGIEQLSKANTEYLKAVAMLGQGRAKNGQSNKSDWGAVGTGAVAGATIGSVLPGIGTVVGAVGGAIVGGLIGLFGGQKRTDDYIGLLQKYPTLLKAGANGQAEINKELAQSLLANNQLDEATQQLVQNALDWQTQIEKAKEQVKGIVSDLAGSLGDSLRDALVGAFKEGTDAAEAFKTSVSATLESMLSQILFNRVFSAQFDQLQKEMIASYDGGDGTWVDDFGRFFAAQKGLSEQFTAALTDAQKEAEKYGLSVFGSNAAKSGVNKTLSNSIKGVSEETAGVLAGQMNAIRITQADTNNLVRQQLMELTQITINTAHLRDILKVLKDNRDPLRAKGIGPP